jgi:phage tail-like protein
MRGTLEGLISPVPIGGTLPAVYLTDPFTQQLCAGLDEVLAPVLADLDSLPAYFDPGTTPEDLLSWLAGWLGLTLDSHQSEERKRALVRSGVHVLARRGTVRGIGDAVEAVFDRRPEIIEPGGAHWSPEAGTPLPGRPDGELLVRLAVPDPAQVDPRRLDEVVAAVKPAHISHRVEVVPV